MEFGAPKKKCISVAIRLRFLFTKELLALDRREFCSRRRPHYMSMWKDWRVIRDLNLFKKTIFIACEVLRDSPYSKLLSLTF